MVLGLSAVTGGAIAVTVFEKHIVGAAKTGTARRFAARQPVAPLALGAMTVISLVGLRPYRLLLANPAATPRRDVAARVWPLVPFASSPRCRGMLMPD